MGREIRRVPKGWKHPKDENGNYKPSYDEAFKNSSDEWMLNCLLWFKGEHLGQAKKGGSKLPYYWQWAGNPPDEDYYRPEFKNANCYQVYETVTEGTPVSPVFESKKEIIEWLVDEESYSKNTAKAFVEMEWTPSLVIIPGVGIKKGIEASEFLRKKKE